MKYREIIAKRPREKGISETASSGSTSAASVATVPSALGGLGVGFDPNGDWGIYQHKKNKKNKKPIILRR